MLVKMGVKKRKVGGGITNQEKQFSEDVTQKVRLLGVPEG